MTGRNLAEKKYGLTRIHQKTDKKKRTSIVEGGCGGCVEVTQSGKNLILSENKNF